jgi:uncharacterized Tic20 family protein
MSRHRSEPPADWLPSSDEGTAHPAPGEALPRRPVPSQPRAANGAAGTWYPADDGQPANGSGDHPHQPGYAMPDYPPAPGYPPAAEYPAVPGSPGYQPADGSPVISHDEYGPDHQAYDVVPDRGDVDHHGLAPDEYGVVYDGYGLVPEPATARLRRVGAPSDAAPDAAGPGLAPRSDGSAARWAMLGYLTVPLFGFVVPSLVYLRALRGSGWSRAHAAQALNVWITVVLYDLSAAIMGAMLALDSPQIALIVFGPLVMGLWLVMLTFLVRAATAASQGLEYTVPRWLCSPIVH